MITIAESPRSRVYTYAYLKEKAPELYKDGDYHQNLKRVLKYLDPDKSSSYDNWVLRADYPQSTGNCVCSHEIGVSYVAQHITTGDAIEIGSACIRKFSDKIKKSVDRANRKRLMLEKDPNTRFCDICDKKLPSDGGKTLDNYYHKKCLQPFQSALDEITYKHQQLNVAGNFRMPSGKHTGKRLKEIIEIDPRYLSWYNVNITRGKAARAIANLLEIDDFRAWKSSKEEDLKKRIGEHKKFEKEPPKYPRASNGTAIDEVRFRRELNIYNNYSPKKNNV